MPELPEVETVKRGLAPAMEGARLTKLELRRANLRYHFQPDMVSALEGNTITGLSRRAKYLLVHFSNGQVLVCHLGMSGSFRVHDHTIGHFHHERSKMEAHDHVIFHIERDDGTKAKIIYNDPRRFGFMFAGTLDEISQSKHIAPLGVEPTGNALDGTVLAEKFREKTTNLKAALLDQRLIAGLGNIYVCEALWRSGLSPRRQARALVRKTGKPTQKCDLLAEHIRHVISDAIDAGGSSLRDHVQTDGSLGYFQHSFAVYDQEGKACAKNGCTGKIKRIVQSGRSTFYCPACQK